VIINYLFGLVCYLVIFSVIFYWINYFIEMRESKKMTKEKPLAFDENDYVVEIDEDDFEARFDAQLRRIFAGRVGVSLWRGER